jgi:DNA-binding response OmpR family regulator
MRILIVEDEPDLLASLAQALCEEGYAVDTADNGGDGLFNAEGTDYDAIVLDVMLPGRMAGKFSSASARPGKRPC